MSMVMWLSFTVIWNSFVYIFCCMPRCRSIHSPLNQECELNIPPYFHKMYKFPPYFCSIYVFLPNLCFFASPILTMMHLCIMLYMYWMPLQRRDKEVPSGHLHWLLGDLFIFRKWTNHSESVLCDACIGRCL